MESTSHPEEVLSPGGRSIPHFESHRPILDGHEVVEEESLRTNWDALQFPWDIYGLASLRAAADVPPNELDDDFEDGDNDPTHFNDRSPADQDPPAKNLAS